MICRKCKKEVPEGKFCLECGANQMPPAKAKRRRGNGQGTVIKEDNGTYTAIKQKYIGGKRKVYKKRGFKKRSDALEYLATFAVSKVKKTPTLLDLHNVWSASSLPKLGKSRQNAYSIAWRRLEPLHNDEISQITIGDLQEVIDSAVSTYYPARDMKTVLSHLYKRACAQGDAPTNLSEYIELPPLDESDAIPFNKSEVESLWKDYDTGNTFTGYLLLMIYTGMMPGELMSARKDQIDWEKRTIIGAGIKTKKRKKTPLVIAEVVMPVLERLCEFSSGEKILTMNKDNFYKKYYEALERAGCRRLTPYACRHTTGTNLALNAQVPPSVIQEVMRHTKFSTTQKYIHPNVDDSLDAVNKLH